MPNGFVGQPARAFLRKANEGHNRAIGVTQETAENNNQIRAAGVAQGAAISNAMRIQHARELPFRPEDAEHGRFVTGVGNSTNIVVNQDDHARLVGQIHRIDDAIGECVYSCIREIEDLCRTVFVMPTVSKRCMDICNDFNRVLGSFRIGDEAAMHIRNFAYEIDGIGH